MTTAKLENAAVDIGGFGGDALLREDWVSLVA